ncbi:hypothetical protein OBBRIDRAFT_470931 [Obba rivulosa]|uniref:Uncharacterized protein n=1 Tax=Obba rivulosa TaxID=1052685 RepID=A0A8E2AX39_9APHY|nr:hypothetical protein OBBRIDRAFT_470931 [Obba rivulosa]
MDIEKNDHAEVLISAYTGDVPRAVKSVRDAFKDDPLQHYLRDTPDSDRSRWQEQRRTIVNTMTCLLFISKKQIYTVGQGDAVVV